MYAREEYKVYRKRYIDGKPFDGHIPLLFPRMKHGECRIVTLHIWDKFEAVLGKQSRFIPMMYKTMKALEDTFQFNRLGVHRFLIHKTNIYLDTSFNGVCDSSVFNQCVFLNPLGTNNFSRASIARLIIRLGGYSLRENVHFTEILATKSNVPIGDDLCYKKVVTVESLLKEYKQLYGSAYKIKEM